MYMKNSRPKAIWTILFIGLVALFIVKGGKDFVLGLDLAGGSALTYKIDVSALKDDAAIGDGVIALRDVIERRVNLFGVTEPTVNTEYSRLAKEWRLVVELPGITDVVKASKMIGDTPIEDSIKQYDIALNSKKNTGHYIALLEQSIESNQKKISHLDSHEYDPNCKFCCDNVFVKDAMKAKEDLINLVK